MKKKTINKIITAKFNDWTNSIEDENVRKLVKDNTLISGGCIASMLMGEKPNDFDVYFTNKETVKAVARYYLDRWNEEHPYKRGELIDGAYVDEDEEEYELKYFNIDDDRIKIFFKSSGVAGEADHDEEGEIVTEEDGKFRPIYMSPNAITLSDKIQIVLRFWGTADKIHLHYDYVHCTNYWLSDGGLVLNQPALEAILAKELIYVGSKYPIASIIRTRKFIKRGFHINAGQYLKMAFQISELDLTDVRILEDQLIGVDVAYFGMLIAALQGNEEKISYDYIAKIIDKIF